MKSTPIIYLAPFQGITGYVYREVFANHFPTVNKFFTPFFTNVYKHKSFEKKGKEIEKTHHSSCPVTPQILSNDAEEIIRFGNFCAERGFDEINWNLGCPFPRVASKKRGSGLLPYPDLVDTILSLAIPKIPIKLSIKCRLGYHSPAEIFNLLDTFEAHQISELIIHTRIGKQVYKGEVDHSSFERVIERTKLPLVYNGDIFSVEDYLILSEKFSSINKWMIGRGLLVDPFLAGDIRNKNTSQIESRGQIIRRFVEDLYYAYRKSSNDRLHSINIMKELWEYLSFSFNFSGRVFSLIKKTKSFDDYEDAVARVFDEYEWLGSQSKQFNSSSM